MRDYGRAAVSIAGLLVMGAGGILLNIWVAVAGAGIWLVGLLKALG